MRAAVVTEPGAVPQCLEFAEPEPGDDSGADAMTLVGAGLHQLVRGRAAGRHYSSEGVWPIVAGVDAVARTASGDLVYTGWVRQPWGTMAERLLGPMGLPLPAGADPLAVAAGVNPAMSGWLPLSARRDELGRLGTVLVLGATGMSGRLAVDAALVLGADHVVAAGRDTGALAALARPQVSTVALTSDREATTAALTIALGDRDVSLVLDYVWGPVAEAAFDALADAEFHDDASTSGIAYVSIGSMAGPGATLPAALLRSRKIQVRGSGIGSVPRRRIIGQVPEVMSLIADGSLRVPYRAFPLADVAAGWAYDGPERAVVTL